MQKRFILTRLATYERCTRQSPFKNENILSRKHTPCKVQKLTAFNLNSTPCIAATSEHMNTALGNAKKENLFKMTITSLAKAELSNYILWKSRLVWRISDRIFQV
jgi:hypothetical protein